MKEITIRIKREGQRTEVIATEGNLLLLSASHIGEEKVLVAVVRAVSEDWIDRTGGAAQRDVAG